MATTLISIEDYLRIDSKPNCEYVRGVLKERSMPEWDHAAWQSALLQWFSQHKLEWGIYAFPELRARVDTNQFRIPDVAIVSRQAPRERFLTHAPLAVFEILSPGDSMADLLEKLEAYEAMGIPAIWVIDPGKPVYSRYTQGNLVEATVFELPGTNFTVPISEIEALVE
jgi:Uma2 family endonuclease